MDNYTNHSGGCPGADMCWETAGNPHGVKSIAYSFYNHVQEGANQCILTPDELLEGWKHVEIAAKSLKRPLDRIEYPYIKNLISRNWFQVKNAEKVFAVGKFDGTSMKRVSGGTGWAVQMAIDSDTPVCFFNQPTGKWYTYLSCYRIFVEMFVTPTLTQNFAGIGTREIDAFGVMAIQKVYSETFKSRNPKNNGKNTI
jgi:hypothetical protein